ncbi:MAG TPA: TonB-dependent receptor [Candidatus Acidoferrales bacterium]|nr:TonB-dependent receptor [Candidatus Acidoferrales bacterium]
MTENMTQNMRKKISWLPLLALWFSPFVASAFAQTSRVGATIEGTVTDSSGGSVAAASIRIRNQFTNITRVARTDSRGLFRVTDLRVGVYEVRVERSGFAPYLHASLQLELGADIRLGIVLAPASAETTVTVTAQPSALEPTETSITSIVDRERIEELPVESRNALDFVLIEPAVTESPQGHGSPHTALADSGFTFGGLRARSNSISIDGLDNNDEFTGSSRTELSPEIVQEYQVVHNNLSAEFGGASGGSINVVTRAGSNFIHGDAFIFLQDAVLNARDPFETDSTKPNFHRFRAGFAIGGPIIKNRTFYYTAFEQEYNRGQNSSNIAPAAAAAINSFLVTGAFPRLSTRQITTGFFPIARAETEASGKLDHQLTPRTSLMLRYAFTNNREPGDGFNTGGLQDTSARGSSFVADNAVAGSLVSTYGSNAVSDLRFEAATRHQVLRTNDVQGPGIDIAGLADFGRPYLGNSVRRENHYQVTYTYARSRGNHLWKAGATINRVHERASTPDGFGGLYLFGSAADFFAARPDFWIQGFGNSSTNFTVTSYGGFLQDHWSASRHLTFDLGARYDFEHLPVHFNQDTNNFSPRIGLAYNPNSRWVVRAGFGIFFDRQVLASLNRAIEENGINASTQVTDGNAAANIFESEAGGAPSSPVLGIAPSIFRPDPRLASSYSQQSSLGLQYLIAHNLTAGADYLFVRGVKLSRTRNINLLPPVILTPQNAASLGIPNPVPQQLGREVFGPGRLNPRFNDIYQIEDSAGSTYNGVTFSLNRRMADELEFLGSYTFSKTLDDASDFPEQPQNPFDVQAERALSLQHQQQRFVFDALWDLPIGSDQDAPHSSANQNPGWLDRIFGHIEVAPIFTLGTGRRVNPLVGLDVSRGNAFPLADRPLNLGRNSLQTGNFESLDFRVLKYFPFGEYAHLDLVAEAFNLFNHPNVAEINPYFGSGASSLPGFGAPIEGFTARRVEFSIDFEY